MSTPLPCRDVTLELPWLLAGSLEAGRRREVREHLIHCAACRQELARTREVAATFEAAARPRYEPTARPATVRSFAARGPVVRRWSLAAAAALLLASGGVLFEATRAPKANDAVANVAEPAPASPGAQERLLFRDGFNGGGADAWKQVY